MATHIQPSGIADEGIAGETAPPPVRRRRRLGSAFEIALLALLAVVMLFPVVWMLETALKDTRDIYAVPAKVINFGPTLEHLKDVFSPDSPVFSGFQNSIIVATASTIIATVLGVPAAWAYSRFPIPAKKDQLFFILSTRFMPPVVVVIPVFLMFRDLALLDTLQGLILVYAAFNLPFTIWMMKGFIDELPAEYEEAAMLDGYSRFEAFWRVTMPLLIPGIAATAVFALIFSWNEFVFSIFLITDPGLAHGAGRDRGPDRRHDDRLGPGGRVGDGLRPAGAGVRLPGAQAPGRRRHARGGPPLMAEVLVKRLRKEFPDGTVAVEELDLEIADGELFVLLGPSGCGKTTTLRCVAGLEQETSGQIVIGDEVVSGLRPSQRDIAMVFQFYALYPHMSVRDNLAFPLRAAKRPAAEVDERVNEAARMLRLEPFLDPPAGQAVRRRAAARRARAGDGPPPEGVPDGRAADQPRRRAARRHARGAQARPAAAQLDDDLRDPRPDRGDGAGAPDRDHEQRAARAARRADGGLRPAGDAVRRALHRLAADEPDRGRGHQRAPDRRRRAEDRRAGGHPARRPGDRGRAARELHGRRTSDPDGARGRVVSREALGDETIYVVETEAGLLNVRMPPTARFGEEQVVSVRHEGAAPPVYDPQTERLAGR